MKQQKLYPRQKYYPRKTKRELTEKELVSELMEIRPLLYKKASKISRPYYCDLDELVQEAMLRIFSKRKHYKYDKHTSVKTWALIVAERQYYKIAEREYRKMRVPQGKHLNKSFVQLEGIADWVPMTDIYKLDGLESEYYYNELIIEVDKNLKRLSRKIFNAILNPTPELLAIVKNEHKKRIIDYNNGRLLKKPNMIKITNQNLSDYFGVKTYRITRAKSEIKKTMMKVFNEQ